MGIAAKRKSPDPVPPVTVGGIRYEVIHWGMDRDLAHNGGYIAAVDPATGEEKWMLEVYPLVYEEEGPEQDLQENFIASMRKVPFRPRLRIEDERGNRYTVHLDTRTVTP